MTIIVNTFHLLQLIVKCIKILNLEPRDYKDYFSEIWSEYKGHLKKMALQIQS